MRVCEISHFFCYAAYRRKATAMAKMTEEKELLITPAGWIEDYHGSRAESDDSSEYSLRQHRAFLNWKIWGGKRFQLFVLSCNIVQDMREYDPDIIAVDSEPFGLLAFEVALIRQIYFPHARLIVHSSQNLCKSYPFPFNKTESFVMQRATALFARTEEVRRVLLRKGCPNPVYVIPHGVDTSHFRPASETAATRQIGDAPLYIGFVGSLVEQKGVHILIEAVSGLDRPFELTIVGNGSERITLEALAAQSPVKSHIRFQNSIPNAQLPNILRTFDVLVVPSVTVRNWKEQFGRIIIEAMACGIPVVGSTCGSIPEVIGDGGMVFVEEDADHLCSILERAASDRGMLRELSIKARRRAVEHFSWEGLAPRIHSIYCDLARQMNPIH